jgi:CCR4-NOT complex subunit CAF16
MSAQDGGGGGGGAADQQQSEEQTAVKARNVSFFYNKKVQALYDVSLTLPRGCRCLLVGDNGAGKTTLLKLFGGQTSTRLGTLTVLDEPADFSPSLNLRRAYLGGDWGRRIVPFAGVTALTADIGVAEMMTKLQAEFPERRKKLFELLQIDESWRMHQVRIQRPGGAVTVWHSVVACKCRGLDLCTPQMALAGVAQPTRTQTTHTHTHKHTAHDTHTSSCVFLIHSPLLPALAGTTRRCPTDSAGACRSC